MAREMHIHIYAPRADAARTLRRVCPTCKRRTTFFAAHVPWFGWRFTCLACGDKWEDGERLQRPFMPGWRQENVRIAKKQRTQARAAKLPRNPPWPI